MVTILTIEHMPGLIADIQDYIKKQFDITESAIKTVSISALPRTEEGYSVEHINGLIISDYWSFGKHPGVTKIDDVSIIADVGDIVASQYIKPKVWFTDDMAVATRWLAKYDNEFPIVACDFEAKNLTLPYFNPLTMVAIGWNLLKSTVFVFNTDQMRDLLLNWLVTTKCRQVWHNSLFDLKMLHFHTKKIPLHVEDSQLLAAVYNNHVDEHRRKSGLKGISGPLFGEWAENKASFDLYDTSMNDSVTDLKYVGSNPDYKKYNLSLIKYNGIDINATKYAWDKYNIEECHPAEWIFPTSEPRHNTEGFNQRYYYEYILKPAIPMVVEMMNNGQEMDLDKVDKLKKEVEDFNEATLNQIKAFPEVEQFHAVVDKIRIDKFLAPVLKAMKHPKYDGYKNNVAMRTFVVNYYNNTKHDKVTAANLKLDATLIGAILHAKQFNHPAVVAAAARYEETECLRQNTERNRIDKIKHPEKYVVIGFNPYNYSQLGAFWKHIGLVSDVISKDTKEMSFSSDVLKRLAKETDGNIQQIIKLYLEVAQSKNMITQYIPKYLGSTINGRLHYSLKLMGTFTG